MSPADSDTETDTAAAIAEPKPIRALDLMNCPTATLTAGPQLHLAVHALLTTGQNTVAVVDNNGYLTNLVTEDSVAEAYLAHVWAETVNNGQADLSSTILDFALPPLAIDLHASLTEIVEIMLGSGLYSLPVVQQRRPVGIISWREILSSAAGYQARLSGSVQLRSVPSPGRRVVRGGRSTAPRSRLKIVRYPNE